jgi:anion-transporting  ArsA/GET3 family ATPase
MSALSSELFSREVIVCVGAGGVGKTTIAATVAMRAALEGKRAIVLTIDPARRLANALGLDRLGNQATRVDLPEARGELWAMMLDLKRSWDDFVGRTVSPEKKDAILENRFYRTLSSSLAGSQEYIATEKLYELHASGAWDVLVLDTPPTQNALDFLDAPKRILDFLGNDALRRLLAPALVAGRFGLRLFQIGGNAILKALSRLTGIETLEELARFLVEIQPTYDHFKERAARVRDLLASDRTAFLLVTSAQGTPVDEAISFHRVLVESRMPLAAVVANRVHPDHLGGLPLPSREELADELVREGIPDSGRPPLSERLHVTLRESRALAALDAKNLERLAASIHPTPHVRVPRFSTDVYDLPALRMVAGHLFARS